MKKLTQKQEKQLEENLKKLPYQAYVDDETTGAVIVMAGYEGYYPIHRLVYEREGAKNFIERKNKENNVTNAQAQATKAGSMFGFYTPAANPDNWNEDGTFKKQKNNN